MQRNLLKESEEYTKTKYEIISLKLQQLILEHPDFLELLLLVSIVGPQNIPYELLKINKDEAIVYSFINHLNKYSLVTTETSSDANAIDSISMHQNEQENIYHYLRSYLNNQQIDRLLESIVYTIEKYIVRMIETENFQAIKNLSNHCQIILDRQDLLTDSMKIVINGELGEIYHYLGNYQKSLLLLKNNLAQLKESKDHFSAVKKARISLYLGEIYKSLGNYQDAIESFNMSIKLYEESLPIDYKSLGRAISNLGNLYRTIGDCNKAQHLLHKALALYKKHLPTDHINISWILLFLGYVEENLGNYREAKKFFKQSLSICQKYLPNNPVKHAWALANIGNMNRELGYYEKAKNILCLSLDICKKELSRTHKGYMTAVVYLGEVEINLGNYDKARDLLTQALMTFKESLTDDTLSIAWTESIIGMLKIKEENYSEAIAIIEKSLSVYKKIYDKNLNNAEVGRLLNILGEAYYANSDLEKAEELFQSSIKIMQQNSHNSVYKPLENLAILYVNKMTCAEEQNNTEENCLLRNQAIKYFNQALNAAGSSEISPHYIKIKSKLCSILKDKATFID